MRDVSPSICMKIVPDKIILLLLVSSNGFFGGISIDDIIQAAHFKMRPLIKESRRK